MDVSGGDFPVVSGGDSGLDPVSVYDVNVMSTLISTNYINIFDRTVAGSGLRYHYAVQEPNGDPVLYMSDDVVVSGSQVRMVDAVRVQISTVRISQVTHYNYTVSHGTYNLSPNGYIVYTNALPNYPILGDMSRPWAPSVLFVVLLSVLCLWYVLRRSIRR